MQIFGHELFWFFQGILFCLAMWGLRIWMQDRHIRVPWWKWTLVVLWLCFAGLSLAFVGTSLAEGEVQAATLGGLWGGVIAVISGVAIGRVLQWK